MSCVSHLTCFSRGVPKADYLPFARRTSQIPPTWCLANSSEHSNLSLVPNGKSCQNSQRVEMSAKPMLSLSIPPSLHRSTRSRSKRSSTSSSRQKRGKRRTARWRKVEILSVMYEISYSSVVFRFTSLMPNSQSTGLYRSNHEGSQDSLNAKPNQRNHSTTSSPLHSLITNGQAGYRTSHRQRVSREECR